MWESPGALGLITLHLENSETLLPVRLTATILPETAALKNQIGNYNCGEEENSLYPKGSFSWTGNQTHMKQVSKTTTFNIYIFMGTCTYIRESEIPHA